MTTGVRAATTDELGTLAAVLGRAYADDSVWSWVYPQPDPSRRLARMFRPLLRATQDRGATVAGGGPHLWPMWRDPPRPPQ